jgi:bifunctional DNA-binding transcriptional regulator/antitoxin component of YhaV-PrlF toxin-antitoxin module
MTTTTTYEVITQLDEKTGDIILPIPQELLDGLGWREDDEISITKNPDGTFVLTKITR